MKEMIIRIQSDCEDADILTKRGDSEFFKRVKKEVLIHTLEKHFTKGEKDTPLTYIPKGVIGYSEKRRMIVEPGQKKIVIYHDKSYNISFPNSIYIVTSDGDNVLSIEAYTYKRWKDLETTLYKYPMPNMLSGCKICIGTAPRRIIGGDYKGALDKIIYTQYTHSNVNDIKSFKDTGIYFDYLENNPFPYDLLKSAEKKVGDLFE